MLNTDSTRYSFIVAEDAADTRLDRFLTDELLQTPHELSRERLKALIQQGHVCVNHTPTQKPAFMLEEGDFVQLSIPEAKPLALQPEAIPLEVVYEDPHLLVIDKPTGMLTHPAGSTVTGTLVNALLAHCAGELSGINGWIRPGIVHRLDRDTAGLLMVAKTDTAHRHLSAQLKEKTAVREYLAIAQGHLQPEIGTIEAPIGRNPKQRQAMQVHPAQGGRAAITHWHTLEHVFDRFSLLRLRLETGRTHQIRVHLSHIRHPIVGDLLYGTGLEKTPPLKPLHLQGQLLQAVKLSFVHPVSQKRLTFERPMNALLSQAWAFLQQLP
ncbi:MAG: RluA family pseudouridine synthase [Candidatus Melainabacteria bacterium]|nr:RluA family pseudouridine synthase [Candidatus Melainabacteria bacterium]